MTTGLDLGLLHDDDQPAAPRRSAGGRIATVLFVLATLGGLGLLGLAGVRSLASRLDVADYPGSGTGSVVVQVRTGDTASDIARSLYDAGVVQSEAAFRRAAGDNAKSRSLQPAYYSMRKQMKASSALALMLDPASQISSRVVIPEGTPLKTTLARVARGARIPLAQLQSVARKPAALHPPAACKGALEGCLYPATYLFAPGTSAATALGQMVERFRQAADELSLDARAKALHLTASQVLVVASLVEREAGLRADFPKVARVVYNRLAKRMRLQFDSTVNYVLPKPKGHLSTAETRYPSAYNTYLHTGLPPGPIDSPGELALRAALSPTAGSWLYFVTIDKAGHTGFATTYADFLRLKAQGAAALR